VTSNYDATYNCIAYAAGDLSRKWDPSMVPLPGYYWPPGADRGDGPDSLRSAFEKVGFELCTSPDLEPNYDKVALYIDKDGLWSHAAKQREGGDWSSKLGNSEDIAHKSPHCFDGSIYGNVCYYMRRRKSGTSDEKEGNAEGSPKGNTAGQPTQKPDDQRA